MTYSVRYQYTHLTPVSAAGFETFMAPLTQDQLFFHTRLSVPNTNLFEQVDNLNTAKSETYDPGSQILIFSNNNQYYVCNPLKYDELISTDGLDYRTLSRANYDEFIKKGIITLEPVDSFEWMKAVGLGDMTWYSLGEVAAIYGGAQVMTWIFPPLLGIFVFAMCCQQQLNRFQTDHCREPTAEERKMIMKDAAAVGLKMTASVYGWTLAADLVAPILIDLLSLGTDFALGTSTGFLGNFVFALTAGVLAAFFIFFAAAAITLMTKGIITSKDWKDIGTATLCAFFAGTAWGLCAALPVWLGGSELLSTFYAAAAILFTAVTVPFLFYDYNKNWHTLTQKTGSPVINMLTFGSFFNASKIEDESPQIRIKKLPQPLAV